MDRDLPNIENALKMRVDKSGKEYRADAQVLPGSPPVGIGKTELEAKYNLLVNMLYQVCCEMDYESTITRHVKDNWDAAIGR